MARVRTVRLIGQCVALLMLPGQLQAEAVRPECPPSGSDGYYFAPGSFRPDRPEIDAFRRNWYSRALNAAGEPSLSCHPEAEAVVYRFTWLRSFHHPVFVRVVSQGPRIRLVVTGLEGAGGYGPGNVSRHFEKQLSKQELDRLLQKIADASFWAIPAVEDETGARDGAEWIVEGARGDDYRVVERWSPQAGAFRDLGLSFIETAGFKIPEDEVY